MQIITIEDRDFSTLLDAWRNGKHIGSYEKNGKVQIVIATKQFMLISTEGEQKKIAIRPSRSLNDAENCALQFLIREEQRGVSVNFSQEFDNRNKA
jgi:hypothetical protein